MFQFLNHLAYMFKSCLFFKARIQHTMVKDSGIRLREFSHQNRSVRSSDFCFRPLCVLPSKPICKYYWLEKWVLIIDTKQVKVCVFFGQMPELDTPLLIYSHSFRGLRILVTLFQRQNDWASGAHLITQNWRQPRAESSTETT